MCEGCGQTSHSHEFELQKSHTRALSAAEGVEPGGRSREDCMPRLDQAARR
jgi:hypothetical protein